MYYYDIFSVCLGTVLCTLCFFFSGYAAKNLKHAFRLMYFLPAVAVLAVASTIGTEKSMIPVYIGAVICALGFFRDKLSFRRIVSLVSALCTLAAVPVCLQYKGYRSPDYCKEFDEVIRVFKQRYILSEWKGIDYDALYEKYKPMFEKAKKDHDEFANYAAMKAFLSEFHDGHVGFSYMNEYSSEEIAILSKLYGEDHGLVLMNLEDGRTVAVQVDRALAEKGIHNGTIITLWNGKPVEEAAEEVPVYGNLSGGYMMNTADADNRYFYRSTLLAGTGGDSVEVGYIADDGSEQTAVLSASGDYYSRLKSAMKTLDSGVEGANFSWSKVKGGIPVLRIKSMFFDAKSDVEEMKHSGKSYSEMKESLRKNINEAKDNGTNDLIIDLRNNSGGSGNLIRAIAELLGTEGEHLYNYNGVWDSVNRRYMTDADGRFLLGKKNTLESEGILDEGRIVILVNAGSISAADHLVHVMSQMNNVTVMGFTKPNGSGQGTTGIELDKCFISMSGAMMLNEDGTPYIDSGKDGISGNSLDIKVPFDEEALKAVFDKGEDYLLNKAVEYLNQ